MPKFLLGRDETPLCFCSPTFNSTAAMVSTRRNGIRSIHTPSTTTSGTPSTAVSPLLSSHNSVIPETPDTSDLEQDPKVMKVVTKSLSTNFVNTRKRPAEDAHDDQDCGGRRSATKRRVIQKAMFVEIPMKSTPSNSKARIAYLLPPSMLSVINIQQATPVKGKGRAFAPFNANNDDNVHLISEDELDYDENLGESDASDPEFMPSDSDFPLALKNRELPDIYDLDGDEDVMVAAAIELSCETARLAAQDSSGVGSSSRVIPSPSRRITKKAVAVERRLKKTVSKAKGKGKGKGLAADSDDGDFILVESESELSVLTSSEDEMQLSKGKGKATDNVKYIVTEPITWAERAVRRRQQAAERRVARKEEIALMQELGRRLTWVSDLFLLERWSDYQHRQRKPLWH